MGGTKVINSATKLFTLDSDHYIGIMIFGNADINGIPWEVIIKTYREQLSTKHNRLKNTVDDYVEDFLDYVRSFRALGLDKSEQECVFNYAMNISNIINSDLRSGNATLKESIALLNNRLSSKQVLSITKTNFIAQYRTIMEDVYYNYYSSNPDNQLDEFIDTVYKLAICKNNSDYYTGIVIAGYGKKEVFPSMFRIQIDGMLGRELKITDKYKWSSNPEIKGDIAIVPFAQTDVVYTLLTGISPSLNNLRKMQLENIKDELSKYNVNGSSNDLVDRYDTQFENWKQEQYIDPLINLLKGLSVSEMGEMAETLVSLTAFRRKFSNDIGTVGGPTDVLTITRGEGPVWIKRKKYFDSELNKGYLLRRK